MFGKHRARGLGPRAPSFPGQRAPRSFWRAEGGQPPPRQVTGRPGSQDTLTTDPGCRKSGLATRGGQPVALSTPEDDTQGAQGQGGTKPRVWA